MEAILSLFVLIQVATVSVSAENSVQNVSLVSVDDLHIRRYNGRPGLDDGNSFILLEDYISKLVSFPYPFRENSTCKLQSYIVADEANKLNIKALKIIDAAAKIPSGILSGNVNQYGDFDECLSSKFTARRQQIKGKYCLTTIGVNIKKTKYNENLKIIDDLVHGNRMFTNEINDKGHRIPKLETINWGICIPNTCTHLDLQEALQTKLNYLVNLEEMKVNVLVNENMCFEDGQREFTFINKAALLFFTFITLLTVIATVADLYYINQTKTMKYLNCFSLKKNLSILLKTDQHKDEITLLHGARFLNAIALLLSHKQLALMFNPISNLTDMSETLGKPWSMIGRSAILYTDTFILISGLLISYALIKELDEKGKFNFKEKLISRLIRFTPNLFALVIFCTFIIEHLGTGPQWGLVIKQYADLCKKNMWQNFLYVHNYFGFEDMCLTHTHQLGIDMQLFLISPIIIYLLWKNTKKAWLLLIGFGIASTCLRYAVTEKERISTLIYFGIPVDRLWKTATYSYILPTHRLTVYLAGIALGYFFRRNGRNLKISYGFRWFGWILAVSCGLLAMFGPYHVSSKDYTYNVKDAAMYNAFSPILWIIFLSWCIIACDNGYGGWFHKFLSWKYFAIFTRISYAVYLTQFPVFFYGVGTQRTPLYYKGFHSMIDLSEFLVVIAFSVLMTLLFDLPFQNLRKVYLHYSKLNVLKAGANGSLPKDSRRSSVKNHGE